MLFNLPKIDFKKKNNLLLFLLLLSTGLLTSYYYLNSYFNEVGVDVVNTSNGGPNVVVFMVDDLDTLTFKQLLNANKLPNIKKYIIDKGVTFNNSFVSESICCSSRATFLTGMYSHNTGVYNVVGAEGGEKGFKFISNNLATWTHDLGYKNALVGKYMNKSLVNGVGARPGWDYWRDITGYDSRPGSYPIIKEDGKVVYSDYYQAKYISEASNNFIDNNYNNNFFLYVTPHSPHINLPLWGTGEINLSSPSRSNSETEKFISFTEFKTSVNGSQKRLLIKKGNSSGKYKTYESNKRGNSWTAWSLINDSAEPFSGTGTGEILSYNVFNFPDKPEGFREQLIRNNLEVYIRDSTASSVGNWVKIGDAVNVFSGTGDLPIVSLASTQLESNNIVQNLLRGNNEVGYSLFSRARVNNTWTSWEKEPELWEANNITTPIEGINLIQVDNGLIRIDLIRSVNNDFNYKLFSHFSLSPYVDLSGLNNVLGAKTVTSKTAKKSPLSNLINAVKKQKIPAKTISNSKPSGKPASSFNSALSKISIYKDEGELFGQGNTSTKQNGNSILRTNSRNTIYELPLYWSGRIYADGNWINNKDYQSFSKAQYGGALPAGSLRANNDPDGFTPISSNFALPSNDLGNLNSRGTGCGGKNQFICDSWLDLNSNVAGNRPLKDYIQRQHLDRLESMLSVDVMVGEILSNIESKGLINNTLVIFTSDNGMFMGEYSLGNKQIPYENALRVPLLIKPPVSLNKSKENNNTVVNIDLAPTILDYVGTKWDDNKYNVDGRSLKSLIEGATSLSSDWRKWFLVELRYPRSVAGQDQPDALVNNKSWEWAWGIPDLIALRSGVENTPSKIGERLYLNYTLDPLNKNRAPFKEFYDINVDPLELNNLYKNSSNKIDSKYSEEFNQISSKVTLLANCSGVSCRLHDTDSKYVLNIGSFEETTNMVPGGNKFKQTFVSFDGQNLLTRLYEGGRWGDVVEIPISELGNNSVNTLSSFSQYLNVDSVPFQTIVPSSGDTLYYRDFKNNRWGSWNRLTISNLNISGLTSVSSFDQTESGGGRNYNTQTMVRSTGDVYYQRRTDQNNSWGDWESKSVSSLGINSVSKIKSLSDNIDQNGKVKQVATLFDGEKIYYRFFENGSWGSWSQIVVEDLHIQL